MAKNLGVICETHENCWTVQTDQLGSSDLRNDLGEFLLASCAPDWLLETWQTRNVKGHRKKKSQVKSAQRIKQEADLQDGKLLDSNCLAPVKCHGNNCGPIPIPSGKGCGEPRFPHLLGCNEVPQLSLPHPTTGVKRGPAGLCTSVPTWQKYTTFSFPQLGWLERTAKSGAIINSSFLRPEMSRTEQKTTC